MFMLPMVGYGYFLESPNFHKWRDGGLQPPWSPQLVCLWILCMLNLEQSNREITIKNLLMELIFDLDSLIKVIK